MDLPFEASSVVGVLSLHQLWVDNSRTWIRQKLWLWSLGGKKEKILQELNWWDEGEWMALKYGEKQLGAWMRLSWQNVYEKENTVPGWFPTTMGIKTRPAFGLSPSCIWITWRVRVKCELGSQLINRSHPPSGWPDSVLESLGKFQWRIRAKEGLWGWCLAQSTGFPYATVILGSGNGTSIDFCTRQISSSS